MRKPYKDTKQDDYVFGRWPVKEALESGPVLKILIANGTKGDNLKDILNLARKKKVPYHWVDRRRLDQWVPGNHQGIAAKVSPLEFVELDTILNSALQTNEPGLSLLFLDGIQDPHNVGSILRSAVFFGLKGVVIPKWRSSPVTAASLRTSAGAALLIPVARVSNLATALEKAKKAGLWLVGADMKGVNVNEFQYPGPCGLILGSEGTGLHALTQKKCDLFVSIPGSQSRKGIDSLNVGVACGVLLSHLVKTS